MPSMSEEELYRLSLSGSVPVRASEEFSAAKSRGNEAYAAKRFDEALLHYDEAAKADPTSPIPLTNSAMVLLNLNRPEDAIELATDALELLAMRSDRADSKSLTVKTLLRRATGRNAIGQFALAAHDLNEILQLEPNHAHATRELAQLRAKHPRDVATALGSPRRPPTIQEVNVSTSASASASAGANGTPGPAKSDGNPAPRPRANAAELSEPRSESARLARSSSSKGGAINEHAEVPGVSRSALDGLVASIAQKAPENVNEFDRTWRSLRGRPCQRGTYLANVVGPERLRRGLLGETLTAELVKEFVEAMLTALRQDAVECTTILEVLTAVSRAPRFDLVAMFFTAAELSPLGDLLQALLDRGVGTEHVEALRSVYK